MDRVDIIRTLCRSSLAVRGLAFAFLPALPVSAQPAAPVIEAPRAAQRARLIAMARLDGAVRYFHPRVGTTATAWDSLFGQYAVTATTARAPAIYRQQVSQMLLGLGDPQSRVLEPSRPRWSMRQLSSGVSLIEATSSKRRARLATARDTGAVVIDLRGRADGPTDWARANLVGMTISLPDQQSLSYAGLPPGSRSRSGSYGVAWRRIAGTSIRGRATVSRRGVLLADERTVLPALFVAMLRSGQFSLVSVKAARISAEGVSDTLNLGEGVRAVVRRGELVGSGMSLAPDTIFARETDALRYGAAHAPLTRTLSGLNDQRSSLRQDSTLPEVSLSLPVMNAQWVAAYPSRGYRLLAAVRIWNTINIFSPYPNLLAKPWDAVLIEHAARMDVARDSLEFALGIAAFMTKTNDGHAMVYSRVLDRDFFGELPLPLAMQLIDDTLVVSRLQASIRDTTSIKLGDQIIAIDGITVSSVVARWRPYVAASTPQAFRAVVQAKLGSGKEGTIAILQMRGADGVIRERRIARARPGQKWPNRGGPIFRMLPADIGYVDLERLTPEMVDSMIRVVGHARALIFDMRGYPQGTAWDIGPWLNRSGAPIVAAIFNQPQRTSSIPTTFTTSEVSHRFASRAGQGYAGKTVMLTDERAVSQAEHSGLIFEAMNGTQFVGTRTAGTNGDITDFMVPGGFGLSFSGQAVRHADKRPLQGVGLRPTVRARPTVRGLRAGIDEILSAASRHLGGSGSIPFVEDPSRPMQTVRELPPEPKPFGWSLGSPVGYRIGVDTSMQRAENVTRGALHITSNGSPSYVTVGQMIRAERYRGQRVSLSGYIKTRNVPAGNTNGVGLWMRVDGRGTVEAFDNMRTRLVRESPEWTKVVITLNVPSDAEGIVFGPIFTGDGEAWVSDLALTEVPSTTPLTAMLTTGAVAMPVEQQRAMYREASLVPINMRFDVHPK